MNLGQLIIQLKAQKQNVMVEYDFCDFCPSGLHSWRGIYAELALGYASKENISVAELLKLCEDAVGKTFEGYKGGEFVMSENTEVHVDNYGRYSCTSITRVTSSDYACIIHTKDDQDY